MLSATFATSGGHLNPAVTVDALVGRKITPRGAIGYILAQGLGGIAGAYLITLVIPEQALTVVKMRPPLGPGISVSQGLIAEIVLTFFLAYVVYGTAVDARAPKIGGLFIGLTVSLDLLIGGPISGAAMNPARHLGPAILGRGQGKQLDLLGRPSCWQSVGRTVLSSSRREVISPAEISVI